MEDTGSGKKQKEPVSVFETRSVIRERLAFILCTAVLFAVVFIVHGRSLQNGFVYDDIEQIVNNPWITDSRHLSEIALSHVWDFSEYERMNPIYYRPLMHVLFQFQYGLFHLTSEFWHAFNSIVHFFNSVLVFVLFRRSMVRGIRPGGGPVKVGGFLDAASARGIALLAAIVFSIHPISAEPVNWISAQPELISAFFILAAFLSYLRASGAARAVSILFFALALFSKETAIMFVPFLFGLFLAGKGAYRPSLRVFQLWFYRDWPYCLLGTLFLLTRQGVFLSADGVQPEGYLVYSGVLQSVLLDGPFIVLRYVALFLFPRLSEMSFLKEFDSGGTTNIIVSVIAYVAMGIGWVSASRKNVGGMRFQVGMTGIVWATAFLFPASLAFLLGDFVLSDRYMYVPMIGVLLLLVSFLPASVRSDSVRFSVVQRLCLISVTLLAVAYLGNVSWARSFAWKDTETLFRDSAQKQPGVILAHEQLAKEYAMNGDLVSYDEEIRIMRRIEAKSGVEYRTNVNRMYYRSYALLVNGRDQEALRGYRAITEGKPASAKLLSRVMRDMAVLNIVGEGNGGAERLLLEARRLNPESPGISRTLGQYYCLTGNESSARGAFKEALDKGDHVERISIAKVGCDKGAFLRAFFDAERFLR